MAEENQNLGDLRYELLLNKRLSRGSNTIFILRWVSTFRKHNKNFGFQYPLKQGLKVQDKEEYLAFTAKKVWDCLKVSLYIFY